MNYRQRILVLGLLDAVIVYVAVYVAYLIRFDFGFSPYFPQYFPYFKAVALINVFLFLFFSFLFKTYNRAWQYASIGELLSIIKAATLTEGWFFLLYVTFLPVQLPRSIFILAWLVIILGVGASRFTWRISRDLLNPRSSKYRRNLLIIGAGDAGALVAKDLKHSPYSELKPIGFIDDDRTKQGLQVVGIPVLGNRAKIPEVVANYKVSDIVIAMPSVSRSEVSKLIEICKDTNAAIKILPSVSDLASGKVFVQMIRDVSVEDLLGREPVAVDLGEIAGYLSDRVVLVTGAGGSIGSELCRQIAGLGPKQLMLLGHGENSIYEIELELCRKYPELSLVPVIADVQDKHRLQAIFNTYHPHVVFHAAAHKHVPLMERDPAEAVKNNVLGTRNVAECAHKYAASHFVLVSTDKAVNPTSVMGATKRTAEKYIQGLDRISKTKFVAVRFGNVLGSRGSVIPLFTKQIQEGGPVTVTDPEMIRYFMTIPEAVQLIIQAGALAKGGEVFILDMGKPVKIVDLARDLIRLSGFKPDEDIKITFTGVRPGEKLYEEILTNEEGMAATQHNRIFVGKPIDFSWEKHKMIVSDLEHVAASSNANKRSDEIKYLLYLAVPTYRGVPEKYTQLKAKSRKELETALKELHAAEALVAVASGK